MHSTMKSITAVLGILLASSSWCQAATPSVPGLFAVFNTHHGTFTCQLYFERAPRTVANFVSLVEGSRPWVDFKNATVATEPFYHQTTFHRVIKGFMIQGGSRDGTGTDGPGYRFRDEIHQDLKHHRAGILSMAKTAQPHTNGSQFFVTLAPTPWLDGIHSVFGAVIEGQAVVDQVGASDTDPRDRPLEPQRLQSIEIIRRGNDAQRFATQSLNQGLPRLRGVPLAVVRQGSDFKLEWAALENHSYHAFFSADFETWGVQTLGALGSVSIESFIRNSHSHFFLFIESEPDLAP